MPKVNYNPVAGLRTPRIEALNDGGFAIAMTPLVLDIKAPIGEFHSGARPDSSVLAADAEVSGLSPGIYDARYLLGGTFDTVYVYQADRQTSDVAEHFYIAGDLDLSVYDGVFERVHKRSNLRSGCIG